MAEAEIYQIKVTLQESKPLIWRRLVVESTMTLAKFHKVLQIAMGWTDSHLHLFVANDSRYSAPLPYDPGHLKELDATDSRRARLNTLVSGEGYKMRYEYDFGDGWIHQILVEKILPPSTAMKLVTCIGGKGACPPEDVGGIWGYTDFLEAIEDPDHPEHDIYLNWVGGEFDPAAFDQEAINNGLRALR